MRSYSLKSPPQPGWPQALAIIESAIGKRKDSLVADLRTNARDWGITGVSLGYP